MVEKIRLIQKWKPFIGEVKEEDKADSAYQMNMTMMNVIMLDTAVERCDAEDVIEGVERLSYALKNIENDNEINVVKRNAMARDLVKHIDEQRDIFVKNCKCMKK